MKFLTRLVAKTMASNELMIPVAIAAVGLGLTLLSGYLAQAKAELADMDTWRQELETAIDKRRDELQRLRAEPESDPEPDRDEPEPVFP